MSALSVHFKDKFSIVANRAKTKGSVVLKTVSLLLNKETSDGSVGQSSRGYIVRTAFGLGSCNVRSFFRRGSLRFSNSRYVIQQRVAPTKGDHTFVGSAPTSMSRLGSLNRGLVSVRSRRRGLLLGGRGFRLGIMSVLTRSRGRLRRCGRLCSAFQLGRGRLGRTLRGVRGTHRRRSCLAFRLRRLRDTSLGAKRRRRLRRRDRVLSRTRRVGRILCRTTKLLRGSRRKVMGAAGRATQLLGNVDGMCPSDRRLTNEIRSYCVRLGSVLGRLSRHSRRIRFGPSQVRCIGRHLGALCRLRRGRRISALSRLVRVVRAFGAGLGTVARKRRRVRTLRRRESGTHRTVVGRTRGLSKVQRGSTLLVRGRVRGELVPLNVPGIRFGIRLDPGRAPSRGNTSGVDFLFDTGGGKMLRPVSRITSNKRVTHIVLSLGTVVDKTIGLPAVVFSRVSAKMSNGVTRGVTYVVRRVKGRRQRIVDVARLPRVTTVKRGRCGICGRSRRGKAADRVVRLARGRHMRRVTRVLDKDALARTTVGGTGRLLGRVRG